MRPSEHAAIYTAGRETIECTPRIAEVFHDWD